MKITPSGVALFVNLTETEVIDGKDTKKYSLTLLLDPKNVEEDAQFVELINKQNEECRQEELKKAGPKAEKYDLPQLIRPFSSKDKETGKLIETDKVMIKFRSKYRPLVYNATGNAITVKDVTPGSRIRLEYVADSFIMPASKAIGATLYLHNIQVLENGRTTSSFAAATATVRDEAPVTSFPKTGTSGNLFE